MKMTRHALFAASLALGLGACGAFPGRGPLPSTPIQAAPAGSQASALPDANTGATAPSTAPTTVGGPAGNGNTGLAVTGTIAGAAFVPQVALAASTADSAGSPALLVMLSDQANACGLLSASAARQGSSYLLIALGAGGQAPGTGTYTVGDLAHEAAVQLHRLDASCQPGLADSAGTATSGTVQLDAVSANGGVSGHFAVVVGPQGDAVSGTFQAGGCAPLSAFIDPVAAAATLTTCK